MSDVKLFQNKSVPSFSIIIQCCILCLSTCSEVPDVDDLITLLWSHIVISELYVIPQIGA